MARGMSWLHWGPRGWLAIALVATGLAMAGAVGHAPKPVFALTSCTVNASIDSQEQEMLRLINDYRHQHGLGSLVLSDSLTRASAWKAKHMADRDYVAHDDASINRSWGDRIRDCGYGYNTWLGENIAAGDDMAAGTFQMWKNSPPHNANMLGDAWVVIGIGRHHNADSTYDWYWATDFGGASDFEGRGDVDCSGRVDAVDASLILQRSAGFFASFPCSADADVDNNGSVDSADALVVLQYYAGLFGGLSG